MHRKVSRDGFSFPRGIQEPFEPWVPFFILGGVVSATMKERLDPKLVEISSIDFDSAPTRRTRTSSWTRLHDSWSIFRSPRHQQWGRLSGCVKVERRILRYQKLNAGRQQLTGPPESTIPATILPCRYTEAKVHASHPSCRR